MLSINVQVAAEWSVNKGSCLTKFDQIKAANDFCSVYSMNGINKVESNRRRITLVNFKHEQTSKSVFNTFVSTQKLLLDG